MSFAQGAAAGGVIGAISGPIASHFAQKRAFKYAKTIMKNKHQWEVADLRAAGLNPILGYVGSRGGGGGVVSPGTSTGGAGQSADVVGAYKQAKGVKDQLKILSEQAKTSANVTERTFHEAFTAGSNSAQAYTAALREDVALLVDRTMIPAATAREALDKTKFGAVLRQLRRVRESVPLPFIGGSAAERKR